MSNKNLTPMQAAAETARSLSKSLRRVPMHDGYAAIAEGLALLLDEQANLEQIPRSVVTDALKTCNPEPLAWDTLVERYEGESNINDVIVAGYEYGMDEGKRRTLLALLGEGEMP